MRHALFLLVVIGCGGGRSNDDGLIKAPILDDPAFRTGLLARIRIDSSEGQR